MKLGNYPVAKPSPYRIPSVKTPLTGIDKAVRSKDGGVYEGGLNIVKTQLTQSIYYNRHYTQANSWNCNFRLYNNEGNQFKLAILLLPLMYGGTNPQSDGRIIYNPSEDLYNKFHNKVVYQPVLLVGCTYRSDDLHRLIGIDRKEGYNSQESYYTDTLEQITNDNYNYRDRVVEEKTYVSNNMWLPFSWIVTSNHYRYDGCYMPDYAYNILKNGIEKYDFNRIMRFNPYVFTNPIAFNGSQDENLAYSVYIESTLPVFGYEECDKIYKYFNDGDISDVDNVEDIVFGEVDFSTDWKLYIDGKNPNIKLVWNSTKLEEFINGEKNKEGITLDDIKVQVGYFDRKTDTIANLKYFPYTTGFYTTSYETLAKMQNPSAWEQFLTEISNITGIGEVQFYFRVYFNNMLKSCWCYCSIPYNKEPTKYGLFPSALKDNSTVTVVYNSDGSDDDGYIDREEGSDEDITNPDKGGGSYGNSGYDSTGLFSTTYKMSESRIKSLGGFLWGASFFDNIKLLNSSPIENIVSCKIIPISINGTDERIVLGNVDTGVNGDKVNSSYKVEVGSLAISEYYHSFLDYAPYTKLTIFLPFIGFKELDTNTFMNKTLKVIYIFDLITGSVKAQLFANNVYVQSYDGNAGIDIPLTSSNRAQVEGAFIGSALSAVESKSLIGASSALLNGAMTPYSFSTKGSYSPSCGTHDTRKIFVIYDRPTLQIPSTYGHDFGYPCKLSRSLGSVNGFTIVNSNIDLNGITCTETEREEIRQLLTSGVYL